MLGDDLTISACLPAANVAENPARFFELDPAVLIGAHRAAREGGPAVLGHYHSHPNGKAEPSPQDARDATPGPLWLIVTGAQAALFAAVADGPIHGRFRRIQMQVV